MSQLRRLYDQLIQKVCKGPKAPVPLDVLQNLIDKTYLNLATHNDTICLVLARELYGGMIAQLAPGCWINLVPDGENVIYWDLCNAVSRSGRQIDATTHTWSVEEFLARDMNGSLATRATIFQKNLTALLKTKLGT